MSSTRLPKSIKVASSFCRTGRCTSTVQSWGNVWTTELSETAQAVADDLKIRVDKIELDKNYPMIKCNVNKVTSEKIYHLPIDQQYDKILIGDEQGECYAATTKEAEKQGFRRAWKYRGPNE